MRQQLLFFLLAGALCLPSLAVPDPLVRGIPARPLALGNAYVGLADDAAAVFSNPAGVANLSEWSLGSLYSQPLNDVSYMVLDAAIPGCWGGTIGGGYRNRTATNILVSTETADYIEQDLTLLYAKKINEKLAIGGDLRLLSRGLSKDVPGFTGLNGSGQALDLGLKYCPSTWLGLGLVLRNLAGQIHNQGGKTDDISLNSIAGLVFRVWGNDGLWEKQRWGEVKFTVDLNKINEEPLPQWHGGVEWQPLPLFALRLGLDQSPDSSTSNFTHLTAGFGLLVKGIAFDYAYKKFNDPTQNVVQYFSVGYVGAEEETGRKRPLQPLAFTDVPDDYWARKSIGYLTALGVIDYYADNTYHPERSATRAEMVKYLFKGKDWLAPIEKKQVFPDVTTDFWAADFIQVAYENKLTIGYPDGLFKPRQATTRAEGATFLSRFAGLKLEDVEVLPFPDLPANHWSLPEVLATKKEGLFDYLSNAEFKPSGEISRAEIAETLYYTQPIKQKLKAAGVE